MNEKLKFNLNRLKKDFEDVIDELENEIIGLEEKINNAISPAYVKELERESDNRGAELDKAEEKIEELEDKIKEKDEKIEELQSRISELEQFLKSYKDV